MQKYINSERTSEELEEIIVEKNVRRVMLVCGHSFLQQQTYFILRNLALNMKIEIVTFFDFTTNPEMDEAEEALRRYKVSMSDMIIAAGGGSAIDVAKYVAIFTGAPFIAIPTTAGTGSESTPFAALYSKGRKISVEDAGGLADYVLLDGRNTLSLPQLHKHATMCDALAHAIESIWSIKYTDESKGYAISSIRKILENKDGYLRSEYRASQGMLEAANLAGRAIAIARTTAAHAMSYDLTTRFNIPHGAAVMLVLPELWRYLEEHIRSDKNIKNGNLGNRLKELTAAFFPLGVENTDEVIDWLYELSENFETIVPKDISDSEIEILSADVNSDRLHNFPVGLSKSDMARIYRRALCR